MLKQNSKLFFMPVNLIIILLFLIHPVHAEQDILLYNSTPTYEEIIKTYSDLAQSSPYARLVPCGKTDGGHSMQLFVISKTKIFEVQKLKDMGVLILLINNGIHPGEPDGINASILLAESLLANNGQDLPQNVCICIVPVMNVEGAINRACCSRVNQAGPPEYGFRSNDLYLDLNRDFIKSDSKNMISWIGLFRQWDPEVLIDTHVSDGADYQYTMTLISSQADKLYPTQGKYMKDVLTPSLFTKMKEKDEEMGPYVETFSWELPPDSGMMAFLETPRFGSGYAALFNTFGFISEAHMLKPFSDRVKATEKLLHSMVEICEEKHVEISKVKRMARDENISRNLFPLNWKLDESKFDLIQFKGYEHAYKKSEVTGLDRLYYDRTKSFNKQLPYYSYYIPQDTIHAPKYYLIPQAWEKVVNLFRNNKITLIEIEQDSSCSAEVYYIDKFNTADMPYEGHYIHSNTTVKTRIENVQVKRGDFLVPIMQPGSRYIVETLEPVSVDSYFNWGFFDGVLQQKEWFSAYVFEEIAEKILMENNTLKMELDSMKKSDPAFASNSFSQLYFIYKNSKYFEKGYRRYPVSRIMQ